MFKALKRTLTHQMQLMDHNLMCLDLGIAHRTDQIMSCLEALDTCLAHLRLTLEALPMSHELVARVVLHNFRAQLAAISVNTQLFHLKHKGELESDSIVFLQTILVACENMVKALETTKQQWDDGCLPSISASKPTAYGYKI